MQAAQFCHRLVIGIALTGTPALSSAQCQRWEDGPFTGGMFTGVYACEELNGRIIAAGDFQATTTAGGVASHIASWDGLDLSGLSSGTNDAVRALKVYSTPPFSATLIAGGDFTAAGGVAAGRIASWTESALGTVPRWSAMGPGFNGTVNAIERFNGVIYAAGSFTTSGTTSVSRIARYNGTTRLWEPVGSGLNGTAMALKVYNGALYVGGTFTSAGGVSTGALARWDGASWSAVGGAFGGSVYALEHFQSSDPPGYLMIGGSWGGGSPNLVALSVNTYVNLITSGGTNGPIYAFAADNANAKLYAGGQFNNITGRGCSNTAVLTFTQFGGWDPLQGGTDAAVHAMRVYHGEAVTGGLFGTAGGVSRPRLARWIQSGSPWIARHPASMTSCPSNAGFSVREADGYEEQVAFRWRRNGAALDDGPSPTGATIAGARTRTLQIQGAGNADEGTYDCIVSNNCGSQLSGSATLRVCAGDQDCNGQIEPADISLYISTWLGSLEQETLDADFDHSGAIEPADVSAMVATWFDELVNGC